MNGLQTRKLAKYTAEAAFLTEHAADFPAGSLGAVTAAELSDKVTLINVLAARQSSQARRQNVAIKDDALSRLKDMIKTINRAAAAMKYEIPGIAALFKMPLRRIESTWIATGTAFYEASAEYEAQFIEFDMPATFRSDLLAVINEIRQAKDTASIALGARGGATEALDAAFRDCSRLSAKLKVVVANKYRDQPEKLGAWEVATHLDGGFKRHNAANPPPEPKRPIASLPAAA